VPATSRNSRVPLRLLRAAGARNLKRHRRGSQLRHGYRLPLRIFGTISPERSCGGNTKLRNSFAPRFPDWRRDFANRHPAAGNLAFASNGHQLSAVDFNNPAILLAGAVDYAMYALFRNRLTSAPESGLVVIELSTLGGDPEVARMMGEDIRFHSDLEPARRFVFLGKAAIYSAGVKQAVIRIIHRWR
jgi:hypothetical protein